MGHHDKEPIWITVLKVIGAMLLMVLALGFGALGACGALLAAFGVSGSRNASDLKELWLPLAYAAGGLALAGLAVWLIVLMFRKKPGD
jgi:hypothetical protein